MKSCDESLMNILGVSKKKVDYLNVLLQKNYKKVPRKFSDTLMENIRNAIFKITHYTSCN